MIILDTNIISELMKQTPSAEVLAWLDKQEASALYITTITIAEIAYGINALPNNNRKKSLEYAFNKVIQTAFKHRILNFDEPSSHEYGKLMGRRKNLGRPMSILDGQIAAMTLSQEATLATKNIRDFSDCDFDLINPFL